MTTHAIPIHADLWGGELPDAPELDEPGLAFTTRPALRDGEPTVALSLSWTLGLPYLATYGARAGDAIHVVAVREDTGEVWAATPVGPDSVPLAMTMSDAESFPDASYPTSMSSRLGLDLCAQLGLPTHACTYQVFLWLDALTSPMQRVYVPARSVGSPGGPRSIQRPAELLAFAAGPEPATGGPLELSAGGEAGMVTGRWSPDPQRRPRPDAWAPPYPLTVMAYAHRDRRLGWVTVDVNALAPDRDPGRFQVDERALVAPSSREQQAFALALAGGHASAVLVTRVPAVGP